MRLAMLTAACIATATTAAAQPVAIATDPPPFSIRIFADAGMDRFNASRSFNAIFTTDAGPVYGGGAEVVMRQGWWFRVGAWRFKDEGERALRLENQTFRLGIPLTVTVVPVEVSGGYRFRRASRLVPYVGAGVSSHSYKESSPFSDAGEDVNERFTGYQALAGVEYRIHKWIGISGEVQYVSVPDAIGAGGISADFDETNLGGTIVRARVLFGR